MSKRKHPVNFDEIQTLAELANTQSTNVLTEKRSRLSNQRINESDTRQSKNYQEITMLNDITRGLSEETLCMDVGGPCAGVIEEIYVKNFKCHSELHFVLNPYINFVLGRNGSGKSAVMDAITLCLGGRAASKLEFWK